MSTPAGADSAAASAPVQAPQPPTLAQIVTALEAPARLHGRLNRLAEQSERLNDYAPVLERQAADLQALRARIDATPLSADADANQLVDMQTTVLGNSGALDTMIERLQNGASQVEALLGDVTQARDAWSGYAEDARRLNASRALRERIGQVRGELDELTTRLQPRRDELLLMLERAIGQRAQIDELNDDIAARRAHRTQAMREAEAEPLWQSLNAQAKRGVRMKEEGATQWRLIATYVRSHGGFLATLSLALLLGTFLLIRNAANVELADVALRVDMTRCRRVLKKPLWVAVLVTLLYVTVSAPRGPIAFYDLIWLFVSLPAGALTVAALGPSVRLSVWAIACSLLVSPLRALLDFTPGLDRLIMIAQCLLVALALVHDLWRMRGHVTSWLSRPWIRMGVYLIVAALLVALYANVVGQVGLAVTLRSGVLGTLGVAIVYTAAFYATLGLGLVVLRTRAARVLHVVQRRRATLDRAWATLQFVLAGMGFVIGALYAWNLYDTVPAALEGMMNTHLNVGEASISIGALITALLCLVGTYLLIAVVRVLLEDEILPRVHLAEGVPYAISALTRYALGVAGFMLALAAAGIDMTKITILAGAVGVGVGFGLQNIINNFVSGLILLLERPIHVGDSIETAAASGVVQRIGIRATTIRTGLGGDVVVPNGDLLAKDLLNWTLTSRQRRIDIDIGVGYNSDPEQVEKLLVAAADRQSGVLASPAPMAFFVGFGDNALDFRLMAWVIDANDAMGIGSEIRRTILASFGAAGIEIPFPQHDVWLRETPQASKLDGTPPEGAPPAPA
ncbi:MAG: mechanosensitive ion channel [Rhodocyclaceae bacterium]